MNKKGLEAYLRSEVKEKCTVTIQRVFGGEQNRKWVTVGGRTGRVQCNILFYRLDFTGHQLINQTNMKRTVFKTVALLLACGTSVMMATAQDRDETPYMSKTFSRDQVKNLKSETSGGNIEVMGQSSGDARIEVYVRSNNGGHNLTGDEAKQRLDESMELKVGLEGNELDAVAKQKHDWDNNWRRGISVSFRIYVPESVSSNLRTSGGNIHLSDLTGTEDFETSGGNLHLQGLSGKVTGTTSGGNVDISDSKNEIDLRTSGGNMHANNCDGTITMETSGGSLHLENVKGTVHATTSGGNIDGDWITGELRTSTSGGSIHLDDMSCSLNASTSGGNIDVSMKSMGKYLELENSGGSIHLTVPSGQGYNLAISGDRIHTDKLSNFSGTMDEHSIDGTLNGGGIPIKVHGSSGHVTLSFQ